MKEFLLIFSLVLFSLNLNAQTISINEIVASNDGPYYDEDGDSSDWIELYNPSSETVFLENYSLSDNANIPGKWTFPDVSIPPHGYKIIFCSGKDRDSEPLHTNFGLDAKGEAIVLSNADGDVIDEVSPTPVSEGFALAKVCGGECYWERLTTITPGAENSTPGLVIFSIPSGVYPDEITLTLNQPQGEEIRYTFDGSTPDANSTLYTGPIVLGDATDTPAEISAIPTSPYWQMPSGDVMQVNVVRARVFQDGVPVSQTFSKTYGVGDEVLETFANYPVFSIQGDAALYFNADTGLFVPGVNFNSGSPEWTGNYFMRGSEWERDVDIEYFENGVPNWSQKIGLRIHGGKSRNAPQKSLRLYARDYLGASKFNYPFFETKPKRIFDKLLLRAHFGCWNRTVIKDEVSAYIVRDLDFESQHARPCVVFINGEYWGLYAIRDYFDSNYIEEEAGVEKDSVDILLNGSGHNPNHDENWGIVEGDNLDYLALMDFLDNNDLGSPDNYLFVTERLDISATIDYYCSEIFFAQKDWPSNNYKTWRGGGNTKWRYLFYDIDSGWGFQGPQNNTLQYAATPVATTIFNTPYATFLFRKLLESPIFVDAFLKRYACLLKNELSTEEVEAALDHFVAIYTPGMPENIARWHVVSSMVNWMSRVETKLYDFNALRDSFVVEHISDYFDIEYDPALYDCEEPMPDGEDGITTDVAELNNDSKGLRIYPNPAKNWIWIDTDAGGQKSQIQIYDLMGRLVFEDQYAFHKKVNLANLVPGMYLVTITDDTKKLSGQFIRQ